MWVCFYPIACAVEDTVLQISLLPSPAYGWNFSPRLVMWQRQAWPVGVLARRALPSYNLLRSMQQVQKVFRRTTCSKQ